MARIVIDPGHGGSDPGACAYGYKEARSVLPLCFMLRDYLEERGHQVLITRNSDTFIALRTRCQIERAFAADIFVSVHRNCVDDVSANGVETWHDYGSSKGAILAKCIQAQVSQSFDRNRGVKECARNCRFTVLSGTNAPASLVELGFISNSKDNACFYNHEAVIALQIAAGIQDYLGLDTGNLVVSTPVKLPAINNEEDLDMNVLQFCQANPCNRKNANSPAVPIMQTLLKKLGYYKMKVDDHFGNGCYNAVIAFQKAYGIVADGSCGPATFKEIFKAIK